MNMLLVTETKALLREDLPITIKALKMDWTACMEAKETIMVARINAQKELTDHRFQYRRPKDLKEYTDWDRNIMLEGEVSEVMADFETYKSLEELLGERIKVLLTLIG